MDLQQNYPGATIFWLYILSALLSTSLALQTILSLPSPPPHPRQNLSTKLFPLLSLLSFTLLSYNMLSVLLQSYSLWTRSRSTLVPAFPPSSALVKEIFTWSTHSTLFTDFGLAIVGSKARNFWTLGALLMTMYQSFAMAILGRRYGVPRVWVFFVIAQILPVSFAQNLFYLALMRVRGRGGGDGVKREGKVGGFEAIVVCEVYFWVVKAVAPWVAGKGRTEFAGVNVIIWTILGARAMLVLPYFLAGTGEGRFGVGLDLVGTGLLWHGFLEFSLDYGWLILDPKLLRDVGMALFEHPAVSALGMDFIMSVISLVAWNLLQDGTGETDQQSKSQDTKEEFES